MNRQHYDTKPTLSVVMCTYNGASRHLREQLDTIFAQTLLPDEIIVQDDCSTDDTMQVLTEYADMAPSGVEFLIFRNDRQKGINTNFFSAMRRARGELIAVSDQDDLWLPTKLEEQVAAIGERMMCVCRSVPFSDSGVPVRYDERTPNCNLLRLFYASMMGHCQVLRSELLDFIPTPNEQPDIYRRTCYDVMTATAAAALDSIVLIDQPLVKQRRYEEAATYVRYDNRRTRSASNALFMAWYGLLNWRRVKPFMVAHFNARREFLEWVWRKEKTTVADRHIAATTHNTAYEEGLRLLDAECSHGLGAFIRLATLYAKHRHEIFFTREKGVATFVRALLHPLMQVYNYSYLADKYSNSTGQTD